MARATRKARVAPKHQRLDRNWQAIRKAEMIVHRANARLFAAQAVLAELRAQRAELQGGWRP